MLRATYFVDDYRDHEQVHLPVVGRVCGLSVGTVHPSPCRLSEALEVVVASLSKRDKELVAMLGTR